MRLDGKIALIIGAAGQDNMGQVMARRFSQEGAIVCVAGRDKASLSSLAKEINGSFFLCDITDKTENEEMANYVVDQHGKLDIAVNATGWGLTKKFLKTSEDELDKMLALQFKGPYFFMQSVIPAMSETGGSIIQISSATASLATEHHTAYAGTKAAIDHVVRNLANEFGHQKIRINSIAPGFTKTPMTKDAADIPGLEEAFIEEYPLGRIGTSEDVAAMAVFLASDECFLTGQTLQVNGGLTLRRNPRPGEIAASIGTAKQD